MMMVLWTMKKSKYDEEIIDIDPASEYEQTAGDKDD